MDNSPLQINCAQGTSTDTETGVERKSAPYLRLQIGGHCGAQVARVELLAFRAHLVLRCDMALAA